MADDRVHTVIIGGGFAGVYAARRLKSADVRVTVLDRGTSHVFQPLLYQCATGLLSEGDIASPLRHLLRRHKNLDVLLGEASGIDVENRTITATRFDGSTFTIGYDHLIVGAGMRQSYHGNEQFAAHAPGMKTIDDALAIRRKIVSSFEIAETLATAELRRPWLTFVVSGGGPTGVEIAGQIREMATRALAREFDTIDPAEADVVLVHGGARVLESFHPRLSHKAQRILDKIGVRTLLGHHVTDVGADHASITDKDTKATHRIDTHTVLWTAGVEAVPFAAALAAATGVTQGRGGTIPVRPDLTVEGHPTISVVGDMMSLDDLPGVAEVAMQSGYHAAHNIARAVGGSPAPYTPFTYRDLGTAAYIARYHALLQSGPLRLSGFLGWLGWGGIHITFLAGTRNRTWTLASWAAAIIGGGRGERVITYGDPETARRPYV
ncbi:NAD(P)/FAD-dependent oxidoreductase [Williamsia sterculiae]|uniref:NADH:ubiquinone reductase (non-electrogenic) n=1 Tax=Williamsia sterculiae TaxID=1344003 RepID=A0A1N7EJ48_9NOCA|nr:NAD(P)/FAD-dependent oxidoreductase [Williamsia sterculiae]SIR88064.1 NADH dehydrogenase [Williamsia sterculiae]